jgi:hypothetical protein
MELASGAWTPQRTFNHHRYNWSLMPSTFHQRYNGSSTFHQRGFDPDPAISTATATLRIRSSSDSGRHISYGNPLRGWVFDAFILVARHPLVITRDTSRKHAAQHVPVLELDQIYGAVPIILLPKLNLTQQTTAHPRSGFSHGLSGEDWVDYNRIHVLGSAQKTAEQVGPRRAADIHAPIVPSMFLFTARPRGQVVGTPPYAAEHGLRRRSECERRWLWVAAQHHHRRGALDIVGPCRSNYDCVGGCFNDRHPLLPESRDTAVLKAVHLPTPAHRLRCSPPGSAHNLYSRDRGPQDRSRGSRSAFRLWPKP